MCVVCRQEEDSLQRKERAKASQIDSPSLIQQALCDCCSYIFFVHFCLWLVGEGGGYIGLNDSADEIALYC